MIGRLKAFIAQHWPVLRLRTIIFGTLLFVAALPGVGAVFLRVYENALVRRTEAELVAQSAALGAVAAIDWPGVHRQLLPSAVYHDMQTGIDLRSSPVMAERPAVQRPATAPDPVALSVAQRLAPALAETKQATLASILILDAHGVVLDGPDAGGSLAALPEVRRALAGEAVTVLRNSNAYRERYAFEWLSRASSLRLHHARPIRVDGHVVGVILTSRSPRALFRGIYEDRGKILAGVAIIFVLLLILSAVLSRAIVRPIESLSRATRAFAGGRREIASRPSLEVVEISTLYDDFAVMADSIDRRSRYLRDFAASVSHEFKTPLAGIAGAIELLQDHGAAMSGAERTQFLGNMSADADRLSRLVRRLMELAQADMQASGTRVDTLVAPVLARVADSFRTAGFDVRIVNPDPAAAIAGDAASLEAIATTLLENARQVSASQVSFTVRAESGQLQIDIVDNGPGIPPADRVRIFDPFFTSRRADGGTGLGLAIARSLAEGQGGTLSLMAADNGTHFRLTLDAPPRA